jgi:hypothetical protein
VGQTGTPFKVRFKEHSQAMQGNEDASMLAQHILNIENAYGCTDDTITNLLGSISQWKFITLRVQYTTLVYSSQLF